jgi:hypothetical protein
MRAFLTKGRTQTASVWADVEQRYTWVHRAAHLLNNDKKQTAAEVRQVYEDLLPGRQAQQGKITAVGFFQTSLDRKRAVVSWNDGKGMRFREAWREAEQEALE